MSKYLLAILIAMLALCTGFVPVSASENSSCEFTASSSKTTAAPPATATNGNYEIYGNDVGFGSGGASEVGGYSMAYHATASYPLYTAPVPAMHNDMPALRPTSAGTIQPSSRWQHGFPTDNLNAACNSYDTMARAIHRHLRTGARQTINTHLTT